MMIRWCIRRRKFPYSHRWALASLRQIRIAVFFLVDAFCLIDRWKWERKRATELIFRIFLVILEFTKRKRREGPIAYLAGMSFRSDSRSCNRVVSSSFWLSAVRNCSSRSRLTKFNAFTSTSIWFVRIRPATTSASISANLSSKRSRSFRSVAISSPLMRFNSSWNISDRCLLLVVSCVAPMYWSSWWWWWWWWCECGLLSSTSINRKCSISSRSRVLFLCITSNKFHSSSSASCDDTRWKPDAELLPPMTVVAPAPFVDVALCVSFDELVSVENPESWITLPLLPSPLFGSFLPLCELLRLRVNEDELWISDVSLCVSLRRTRIPGSHSRLLWTTRKIESNEKKYAKHLFRHVRFLIYHGCSSAFESSD